MNNKNSYFSCNGNTQKKQRTFLSIYWKCCHAYSRVYRNEKAVVYEGKCPKCGGYLQVPIGNGGTSQRTFTAQ